MLYAQCKAVSLNHSNKTEYHLTQTLKQLTQQLYNSII